LAQNGSDVCLRFGMSVRAIRIEPSGRASSSISMPQARRWMSAPTKSRASASDAGRAKNRRVEIWVTQ
jgi:outer membrane protein OmpA-like peptidoglycan-associated protein